MKWLCDAEWVGVEVNGTRCCEAGRGEGPCWNEVDLGRIEQTELARGRLGRSSAEWEEVSSITVLNQRAGFRLGALL